MLDARHPVGTFAVNQVADDVEWTPGAGTFGRVGPTGGEIGEERPDHVWRPAQDRQCRVEVKFHAIDSNDIAISAIVARTRARHRAKTGLNSHQRLQARLASALQSVQAG